jgi:hypothetical protein
MKVSRWIVGVLMVGGLVVVAPNSAAASPLDVQTCADHPAGGCPSPAG